MTVEQDTTARRHAVRKAGRTDATLRIKSPMALPFEEDMLERLSAGTERYVAQAPGRLDVMGGLAECTGSLILNRTLGDRACVGVQRRADGKVFVEYLSGLSTDGQLFKIDVHELLAANGGPAEPGCRLAADLERLAAVRRCALGAVVESVRAGLITGLDGGLSIIIGSGLEGMSEAGQEAAITAATLACLARLANAELDPPRAAVLCQRVEANWLLSPLGVADALCALLAEPDVLTQVRCGPCEVSGAMRLPAELEFVGIDCGGDCEDARSKYDRARTAAFMGRLLVDRIIQHDGELAPSWDGYLSRLTVTDYVERFRDRIPTKLKGAEFLDRFGETGDSLTAIEPAFVYRIRSRTEHHIYEHARSCQFVECVSRAIRTGDPGVFVEAGELMYASHWSYGQRCGLGSVKTDLMVNLLRKQGVDAGIFGAKVSGRGCGGVVTVLKRADERGAEALKTALDAYQAKDHEPARVIQGSAPGALVAGVRQL